MLVGLDYNANAASQALLVAVYTVGAYASRRERAFGVVWIFGALLIARAVAPDLDNGGLALNIAIFAAAYLFGSTVRNRRLYTQELEERAGFARARTRRGSEACGRRRAAAHCAGVARRGRALDGCHRGASGRGCARDRHRSAEAKKSLEAIAHTSRTTLTEIRRMLGVLRADSEAEYAPAPTLDDVDRLVRDIRAAGVEVEVHSEGDTTTELPPGVEFTAYRIVQEALTNVLKHAGKARASVVLRYEPSTLRIEVTDDGRGVNGHASDGGHGLMGMRERVGVYGGSFEAGPRVGGGFRVAASLPYGSPE